MEMRHPARRQSNQETDGAIVEQAGALCLRLSPLSPTKVCVICCEPWADRDAAIVKGGDILLRRSLSAWSRQRVYCQWQSEAARFRERGRTDYTVSMDSSEHWLRAG